MKKYFLFLLFVLLLLFNTTTAQIKYNFEYTVETKDVKCNHSTMGRATVTLINPKNPPYFFLWSNGHSTYKQNSSTAWDLDVETYTVKISDVLGNDTLVEISIGEQECEMDPEIVFTPNGDGYNDTWSITNYQFFDNVLILVYNRWGQLVYNHNGGKYDVPWDGRDLLGMPLPDGSYFFIVYKNKKEKNEINKGSVSIIR